MLLPHFANAQCGLRPATLAIIKGGANWFRFAKMRYTHSVRFVQATHTWIGVRLKVTKLLVKSRTISLLEYFYDRARRALRAGRSSPKIAVSTARAVFSMC